MEAANITAPTRPGLTNALAIQLLKYNLTESLAGVSRNPVYYQCTYHPTYKLKSDGSLAVVSSNYVTIEGLSEVTRS